MTSKYKFPKECQESKEDKISWFLDKMKVQQIFPSEINVVKALKKVRVLYQFLIP